MALTKLDVLSGMDELKIADDYMRQGGSILLDRIDYARRPDQIGQRQGERARARSEIGPHSAGLSDAIAQQRDVIVVVHAGSTLMFSAPAGCSPG